MKYCPLSVVFRSWLGALLLAGLGGCTVFHPHRLPTPKPSPEYKAQLKAAKQARKNKSAGFLSRKKSDSPTEEAATDVSTPSGGAITPPPATAPTAQTLPEHSTVRYDKHLLMKKPKLMRRRIHNKGPKPFRPWQSIRNYFKYGRHAKPNYSPDHRPVPPAPKPTPDAAPDGKP